MNFIAISSTINVINTRLAISANRVQYNPRFVPPLNWQCTDEICERLRLTPVLDAHQHQVGGNQNLNTHAECAREHDGLNHAPNAAMWQ
jgi:hypothetical protein